MASTTNIKSGVFDTLKVWDPTTNSLVDVLSLAHDSDLTQRVDDLEAADAAQDTLISSKQDALTQISTGTQVPILSGSTLRPLQAAGDIMVIDQGTHIELNRISAPPMTATTPLSIDANNTMSFDASQTNLVVKQLTCQFDLNAADATLGTIYGGAVTQIQNECDARITNANLEPAFTVDSTLDKYETTPGLVELGLSQSILARLAALEAKVPVFWCAGSVDCSSGTPVILSSLGRYPFTITYRTTGQYEINFGTNTPSNNYSVQISSQQNDHFYRRHNSVSTGHVNTGFRIYLRTRTNADIDVPFSFHVLAD